jgi:hypothetical protein
MEPGPGRKGRFRRGAARLAEARQRVREDLDTLGDDLLAAGTAMESDAVPLSAKADYYRALDAHRRAEEGWAQAERVQDLLRVEGTLAEVRTILHQIEIRMRGR